MASTIHATLVTGHGGARHRGLRDNGGPRRGGRGRAEGGAGRRTVRAQPATLALRLREDQGGRGGELSSVFNVQGGPTEFHTGNGSILFYICCLIDVHAKNRGDLKQHEKYFNFLSKIQLDHPVLVCRTLVHC